MIATAKNGLTGRYFVDEKGFVGTLADASLVNDAFVNFLRSAYEGSEIIVEPVKVDARFFPKGKQ